MPKATNYIQLTHDGLPKALVGTDGSRLYLGFARTINYSATAGILQMSASAANRSGSRRLLLPFSHSTSPRMERKFWSRTTRARTIGERFGDSPSSEVHPAAWAVLSDRMRPGLPMAELWFTLTEANCFWPGMTVGNRESWFL